MQCDNCGKEGAFIRKVTKTYGSGDDLLIIEDVPVVCCPHCHERYLMPETAHALDDVRTLRRRAMNRSVQVAIFGM